APDEYIILRSKLRERIIRGISHYPAFIVSSTRYSRWAVVARNESQAIAYYRKKYPNSMAIQTEQIECLLNEPWFERLVAAWPRHSDPPVGVMLL
ncbi:MAG: hypothetical protein OIF34_02340, partial [Porticoccaceae bacterium]|nr:hypothetical protein [Porticoccaceae bacterium]